MASGARLPQTSSPAAIDDLLALFNGCRSTQLIYVAAKLQIPDLLAEGPKSSEELAREVRVNAQILHRVLRGLVILRVVVERDGGWFSLGPLGEYLRSGLRDSMRGLAILSGEVKYPLWSALLHTVRTGEPAFGHVFGSRLFDYYAAHPELSEHFDQTMVTGTRRYAAAIVDAFDLASSNVIVDVGGGHGALLAAILKAHPHLRGILFDSAHVVRGAQPLLESEGVADRCELIAGDFFEAVPSGGDTYILKWILHDWDDERAESILRNCRRAMGAQGKLLVLERLLPDRAEEGPEVISADLTMMMELMSRERTEGEYRSLLTASGFRLTRIIPTRSILSVIEGLVAA